jgi:uncharacterized membrane protein
MLIQFTLSFLLLYMCVLFYTYVYINWIQLKMNNIISSSFTFFLLFNKSQCRILPIENKDWTHNNEINTSTRKNWQYKDSSAAENNIKMDIQFKILTPLVYLIAFSLCLSFSFNRFSDSEGCIIIALGWLAQTR